MRKYNVENYVRYKDDVEQTNSRLPENVMGDEEAVKVRYLYLVENLARKFSTGQAASGVLDITDLIQELFQKTLNTNFLKRIKKNKLRYSTTCLIYV